MSNADFADFESEANSPSSLGRVLSTSDGERSPLLKAFHTLYLAYIGSPFPAGRPSSESMCLSNKQVRFVWRIVTSSPDVVEARALLRNEA